MQVPIRLSPSGSPERRRRPGTIAAFLTLTPLLTWVYNRTGSLWMAMATHADSAWVTQQARNLAMALDGRARPVRFLIRDRDAKFSRPFDAALRSEGMRVIRTPIRAPSANAYAERVIETMRAECLDLTLIWKRGHLDRTLRTYADHYNRQRPHRALGLAPPLAAAGQPITVDPRDVCRRDLLGGLLHEDHGAAA